MTATTPLARAAVLAAGLLSLLAFLPASSAKADDPLVNYHQFFSGHIPLADSGTNWVPQGLTYWKEKDALIISYYWHDPANPDAQRPLSQLEIVKRSTGQVIRRVTLDESGHVGGLAMTKNYLYIASSDNGDGFNLHLYKANKLLKAPIGPSVGPQIKFYKRYKLPIKGSYMGMNGSRTKLWIGDFDRDKIQRYALRKAGKKVVVDGPERSTPDNVQGVAIRSGRIMYSTSYGNDKLSDFWAGSVGVTSGLDHLTAPNMSEGIVFVGNRMYVVYESSANFYTAQKGTLVTSTIDSSLLSNLGY